MIEPNQTITMSEEQYREYTRRTLQMERPEDVLLDMGVVKPVEAKTKEERMAWEIIRAMGALGVHIGTPAAIHRSLVYILENPQSS